MGANCKGESSLSLAYRLPQGLRAVEAGSADFVQAKNHDQEGSRPWLSSH
jgi:hypothetical protein